jgi:hypothetical protein
MQRSTASRLSTRPLPSRMERVRRARPADAGFVALSQRVADALRVGGYSPRAADAWLCWIERFVEFHGGRHPARMGEAELAMFLDHLKRDQEIESSAHNQALAAVLFLFRQVLNRNPAEFAKFRPQRPTYAVPLMAEMGPGWRGWPGGKSRGPAFSGDATPPGQRPA